MNAGTADSTAVKEYLSRSFFAKSSFPLNRPHDYVTFRSRFLACACIVYSPFPLSSPGAFTFFSESPRAWVFFGFFFVFLVASSSQLCFLEPSIFPFLTSPHLPLPLRYLRRPDDLGCSLCRRPVLDQDPPPPFSRLPHSPRIACRLGPFPPPLPPFHR